MPGYHVRNTTGGDENNPSAAGYLEFGTDKQAVRPIRLNSDGSISLGDGTAAPDTTLARAGAGQLTVNGQPLAGVVPDASGNVIVTGTVAAAGFIGPAKPRRTVLNDGTTLFPSADTSDTVEVTLGGNRTMAAPANTLVASDGQRLLFKIIQDTLGNRTLTWTAAAGGYRFPGGTTPTLTTGANKTDYLEFLFNATANKWDLVSLTQNI